MVVGSSTSKKVILCVDSPDNSAGLCTHSAAPLPPHRPWVALAFPWLMCDSHRERGEDGEDGSPQSLHLDRKAPQSPWQGGQAAMTSWQRWGCQLYLGLSSPLFCHVYFPAKSKAFAEYTGDGGTGQWRNSRRPNVNSFIHWINREIKPFVAEMQAINKLIKYHTVRPKTFSIDVMRNNT